MLCILPVPIDAQNGSFLPLSERAWRGQSGASVQRILTTETNLISPFKCPIIGESFHPMVLNKMLNGELLFMVVGVSGLALTDTQTGPLKAGVSLTTIIGREVSTYHFLLRFLLHFTPFYFW